MPLIYNSYNIFMIFQTIQISENSLISLINQNTLLLWGYFVEKPNQKVYSATINRFSKCLSSSYMKGIKEIVVLRSPTATDFHCISESSVK